MRYYDYKEYKGYGVYMTALWETYWLKLPRGTKGDTGSDGTAADVGLWHSGHAFVTGDRCYHAYTGKGQSVFRCISSHTSSATDEPMVGVNYATYWELFAAGGSDGAGSGDFVGPSSAVSDNLVKFSDTSGKAGADSGVNVNDINFYNKTESTIDADRDADFIKIWKAADSSYYKVHPTKIGRKTESIILTAQGIWPIVTEGCLPSTNLETSSWHKYISVVPFAHTAISYAECDFILPWYYDGGTITARFHWFVPTTTAGTVLWGISGDVVGDGDNLDIGNLSGQEISDATHVTAYDLMITEPTPAITLSGTPAGAKTCMLLIYRDPDDALDTLAETVYLKGVEIRYGCSE